MNIRKFEVILSSQDEFNLSKAEERLIFVLESTKRSMAMDNSSKHVKMDVKKV